MSSVRHLPLDEAVPGMCLGEDLRDGAGQMLLPKGSELSAASLKSLGRRGIETLPILIQAAADEESLKARREASRLRLQHLFRHANEGASHELLCLMLEYRQEHPQ